MTVELYHLYLPFRSCNLTCTPYRHRPTVPSLIAQMTKKAMPPKKKPNLSLPSTTPSSDEEDFDSGASDLIDEIPVDNYSDSELEGEDEQEDEDTYDEDEDDEESDGEYEEGEEDHLEMSDEAVMSRLLSAGITTAKRPSTRLSYKKGRKRLWDYCARRKLTIIPGSFAEKEAYVRWANNWMKGHPRGGSTIENTLSALKYYHIINGVQNAWTNDLAGIKQLHVWLSGHKKSTGNAASQVGKKSAAMIPYAFYVALTAQCVKEGMDWLALVFSILLLGLPRHECISFMIRRDVFFVPSPLHPTSGETETEIYIGGLKTEDEYEAGGFIIIPGITSLMIKHLGTIANDWDDLFPGYSQSYTIAYLRAFARATGFALSFDLTVHVLRSAGAHILKMMGWSKDKIRTQGKWSSCSTILDKDYLSSLSPTDRQAHSFPTRRSSDLMQRRRWCKKENEKDGGLTREQRNDILCAIEKAVVEVRDMTKWQFHFCRKARQKQLSDRVLATESKVNMQAVNPISGSLPSVVIKSHALPTTSAQAKLMQSTGSTAQSAATPAPPPNRSAGLDIVSLLNSRPQGEATVAQVAQQRQVAPAQPSNKEGSSLSLLDLLNARGASLANGGGVEQEHINVDGTDEEGATPLVKGADSIEAPPNSAVAPQATSDDFNNLCSFCETTVFALHRCRRCQLFVHPARCSSHGICKTCKSK